MPEIYSPEWNQALLDLANSREDLAKQAPRGEWKFALEVEGDGLSPYVAKGDRRHFFVHLSDGIMLAYEERHSPIPGKGLKYRIVCPASVFESMAAGKMDPVEKGLVGTITIRGDMRLLMQNAELANVFFDLYTQNNQTEWPRGQPPYEGSADDK